MTNTRMGYDAPKLTRDEATELCVYHLRMAAGLFQLVPDDNNTSFIDEIIRQCDDVDGPPARIWGATILAIYEEMKVRD